MNDYKEIAQMMHLKPSGVKKVINLFNSLDNKPGVVIYNTITTSDLTKQEQQFAFFFWGVNFSLWLQDKGLV